MSIPCPSFPNCCEGFFGYDITIYYSAAASADCPDGSTGGPFISPYGMFSSLISQEDADAQAIEYLDRLVQSQCVRTVTSFVLEMQGPVDDDIRIKINGVIPDQENNPIIFYWDYILNNWSVNWRSTQEPTAIPSGQIFYPITSTDRKWNVEWYAGAGYLSDNFIKIKYTGYLNVGDMISIETLDGWQTQYILSPWQATVTYFDGSTQVYSGGSSFTGTSVDVPSPPRCNSASAPPYNDVDNLAAFLGLPNYISQGYSNGGPFFTDPYANGSFTILAP